MSRRTPGPWVVTSQDAGPNGRTYYVESESNETPRTVVAGPDFCLQVDDAKLISAAPEMLQALKEIMDSALYMPAAMLLGVVEAIAKAEGRK